MSVGYKDIVEALTAENEDAVTADGFEDALIGVAHRFGMSPVALYDREKCIKILIKLDKTTRAEAEEFFEFNVIGSGLEHAPVFADIYRKPKR